MRGLTISALVASALATQTNSDSITLTQFQQIAGFPAACTTAYNTPIIGCTRRDFTNGNPCSQACADGLEKETYLLNSACAGISTSPTTLIGLFFQQQGVAALCPKIAPAIPTTIRQSIVAPTTSSTSTSTTTTTSIVATSLVSSSSATSTTTSTSLSTLTSTSVTSSVSTGSTSASSSIVESSTNIAFTSPSSATATPFNSFDLNGPRAGDSSHLKTSPLAIILPIAGLAIGLLI